MINGDYVQASNDAKKYAQEKELVWEGGFFNPARRIALATTYLEAVAQMQIVPDWYFQGVASGMGVVGVGEVSAAALQAGIASHMPRLVAVQEDTCAPMVQAHAEGAASITDHHRIKNPKGIVQALHRGDPTNTYSTVRRYVQGSRGDIVSVTATNILEAQERLHRLLNTQCGLPSATALAAALCFANERRFHPNDQVLVNLTGNR